ncbi:hypothetical protein M0R45_018208 [Rubus argutus]|uniref:Uncharacterized protein n=1 Tax=Rubus argutus TaxID=59490 RepID=A0AAW1X383_RUBAR
MQSSPSHTKPGRGVKSQSSTTTIAWKLEQIGGGGQAGDSWPSRKQHLQGIKEADNQRRRRFESAGDWRTLSSLSCRVSQCLSRRVDGEECWIAGKKAGTLKRKDVKTKEVKTKEVKMKRKLEEPSRKIEKEDQDNQDEDG